MIQLDEEVEGMQSTIQMLQHELINTKKELQHYKQIVEESNYERQLSVSEYSNNNDERMHGDHQQSPSSSHNSENANFEDSPYRDNSAIDNDNYNYQNQEEYLDDIIKSNDERTSKEICNDDENHYKQPNDKYHENSDENYMECDLQDEDINDSSYTNCKNTGKNARDEISPRETTPKAFINSTNEDDFDSVKISSDTNISPISSKNKDRIENTQQNKSANECIKNTDKDKQHKFDLAQNSDDYRTPNEVHPLISNENGTKSVLRTDTVMENNRTQHDITTQNGINDSQDLAHNINHGENIMQA